LWDKKWLLEEEKRQNVMLKEELRNQLLREADAFVETEVELTEKGIQSICPQRDSKGAKETVESPTPKFSLGKTEYIYECNSENCPQVMTKEIPFMAT